MPLMPLMARMAAVRYGVVSDFDEAVGLGTVTAEDGQRFSFHCTEIADGSRTIDQGTPVEFRVVAGHLGRFEAAGLRRCSG
ncbi:MAG TPA: cold shock domain-containing protein [Acidimicrobiales bacterium]|jgi:CspA family cold shock protein|nr:cold shock domain-containing protein [Acidimicrobiales bacterium]